MSWTQTFPVLTDEMVGEYLQSATTKERQEARSWTRVARVVNRRETPHVVSLSVFWKPDFSEDKDFAKPTRRNIRKPELIGKVRNFEFWLHHVKPLLEKARLLKRKRHDVALRIYLAGDLAFLAEQFAVAGCEVRIMESTSLRHAPGALWRFLALEDRGRLVTISDPLHAANLDHDIMRTETMARSGLGFWRAPYTMEFNSKGQYGYRPIIASQFGASSTLPIRRLFEALVWHTRRGSIATTCTPPGGCGTPTVAGTQWPELGFDEWFLLAAVFPRAARKGMLTVIQASNASRILPIDIEYATWANARSELLHVGDASLACCPPIVVEKDEKSDRLTAVRERPYWNKVEKLPFLLNQLGLCGEAVEVGANNGRFTEMLLPHWKGKRWNAVEQWQPRPRAEWVDEENLQSQKHWDKMRTAFFTGAGGDQRVRVIEEPDTVAARRFRKASLDFVWLNGDKSFTGMLSAIERWWPLLREGGIMAGPSCRDRFDGDPYGTHSWYAARTALRTWTQRTGCGHFLSQDGTDTWLMFKTSLPKPEEVMVITGATKEVGYAAATTANHRAYCQRWGHPYHCYGEEGFDRSRNLCWGKIKMARMALKRSRWVFWMDCDAVFNDWSVPIARLCIEPFHLVCPIWYYGGELRPSLGTFMLKRGEWTEKLLSKVWSYKSSRNRQPYEEEAIWSVMKRSPEMRRGMFAVDAHEFNSPVNMAGGFTHPIIHFLQIKETRDTILADACRMIEDRNKETIRHVPKMELGHEEGRGKYNT